MSLKGEDKVGKVNIGIGIGIGTSHMHSCKGRGGYLQRGKEILS